MKGKHNPKNITSIFAVEKFNIALVVLKVLFFTVRCFIMCIVARRYFVYICVERFIILGAVGLEYNFNRRSENLVTNSSWFLPNISKLLVVHFL